MNKGNALVAFLLCFFSVLHAQTWTHLGSGPNTPTAMYQAGSTIYAGTRHDILFSTDNGQSWQSTEVGLSLAVTGTPAMVDAWSFATTTYTLTNHSNNAFTNISVALNMDEGVVLEGGNEYNATQGNLTQISAAIPVWQVGTLAAGATATIDLNLFTLTDGTITMYGQVITANGTDPNSTPGNGTCCTPNEDDEAVFIYNGVNPPDPTDLRVNIISASSSIVEAGDPFSINVDVRKTGADVSDQFFVGMFLSTDDVLSFTDDIQIGVYEFPNGISSGLVNVDVSAFNTNVAAGTYSVFMVVDHTDLIAESNENNNFNFTTIEFVNSTAPADLVSLDFSLQGSTQLTQGENNSVTYQMANLGDGIAVGQFSYNVYLSSDTQPSSDDIQIGFSNGSNYPAGFTSSTQTIGFNTPYVAPGQYFLVLSADDTNAIAESNENNNVNAIAVTVVEDSNSLGMDLELSFGATQPANPTQWSLYSETLTVTNTGTVTATGVEVEFKKPDGVNYQGGNQYQASQGTFQTWITELWTVGTLLPGASATLQVNYFLLVPEAPVAYAQVLNATETDVDSTPGNGTCCTPNEDDEASTDSTLPPDQPDLTISNFTVSSSGVRGGVTDVSFRINNIGTEDAIINPNTFSARVAALRLSIDNEISQDDLELRTYSAPGNTTIPPGGYYEVVNGFPIDPSISTGTYYIYAKADNSNRVDESDETNNYSSLEEFEITNSPQQGVDLEAAHLATELFLFAGAQLFNYTFTGENIGVPIADDGPVVTSGFYLSTDQDFSADDILIYNINLGNFTNTNTYFQSGSLISLPEGVPDGNYYVIAKIDDAEIFDETNENNNTISRPVTVFTPRPDLIIEDLNLSNTMAMAGEVLNYDFDLSNIGTALAAGDFSIKAYISTDANLSPDDIQDGIVPTGNIVAGVTIDNVPGQSTLPANLADGDYFLILKVDADEDIAESNENNNVLSTSFTIATSSESSCAFISRITTPDLPFPSIFYTDNGFTESNGEYLIEFGPYLENSTASFLSNQYLLDANGNLIAAEAVDYPTSDEEVILEVDEDDNVEMVFVNSVDPPSGTRVTIPLDNLPTNIGAIIFSNPVEISSGYAIGLTVVNGDNGNTSNRVIKTDDQGNVTRTDEIPGLDDTFYSGFGRLTEGSGGIYTEWTTSGNFSLFGIPNDNNSPAWIYRVASDTPSSSWVDTKVSADGQFVYTGKTDNQQAFISKLDATTGELLGYSLQGFVNTNNTGGFRQSSLQGITPTSDGGMLLSIRYTELGNGPIVRGQLIGKLDANGQTVWVQILPETNLTIEPLGETAEGGAIFGGIDRADFSTTDDDQPIFIKTTADGQLTPLCDDNSPSEGVDLELTYEPLGNPNPGQWSLFTATLTLTNTGTEAANGIEVSVPTPEGLVYEGGNEFNLTQGTFSIYEDRWAISSLAPGASVMLEINYFRLTSNSISLYAQVIGLDENDVDSTPGNGECCTANEDDEANLLITTPSMDNAQNRSAVQEHLGTETFAIIHAMPNPVSDRFRLKVYSNEMQESEITISNSLGQIMYTQSVNLEVGINIIPIDLSDQTAGLMTVTMTPFHKYLRQIRIIKIRD